MTAFEYRFHNGQIEVKEGWMRSAWDEATVDDLLRMERDNPDHPIIPVLREKFGTHQLGGDTP